jgi:hypothetical protein
MSMIILINIPPSRSHVIAPCTTDTQEPHVLLFRRPKDYDAQNQPLAANPALANRMVNISG